MDTRLFVDRIRDGGWVPYYDPTSDPVRAVSMGHRLALELFEVVAWGMTIVFALADVVTTVVGLTHQPVTEVVPTSLWVLAHFGWPGLVLEHVVVLAFLAVLWQLLPRPYRLVVPLEGSLAGYLIAHGNLVLLLVHWAAHTG